MASSKEIQAGRGYVKVDADLNPLDKKLKQIGQRFKALGARLKSIGSGVARVGAGATAIGASIIGPIVLATKRFAAFGDTLDKMSARTGVSVESLAELGFAAEQGGAGLEDVEKGLFGLSRSLFDASRGGKAAIDALKEINLTYRDLAGLSPEEQFQKVADNLAQIADESKRGAVAQKLFGRAGRQLLPMLGNLREIRQEARELGLVLGKEDTDNAAKLTDALNRVSRTVKGAFLQVGAAVAEPMLKILNAVTQITARVNHWVAANRALVQQIAAVGVAIAAIGAVVTTVGVGLIGLGITFASIGAIIAGVSATVATVFGAIGSAIAALFTPLGLLTAAIVGLGAYTLHTGVTATNALQGLSAMFESLGSTAKTAWGGIVAAVSSGDLDTAGQIAFTALEIGWLTLTNKMREVWAKVSDFLTNVWLNAVESIVHLGTNIYFGVAKYFDLIATYAQGAFDVALTYIGGAIDKIVTSIAKAIIKAQEFFGLFSAEQSQQIRAGLDADLARRAGGRQRGLDSRGAGRQAGIDQRDQERRSTAKQFGSIVAEDFERRRQRTQVGDGGVSSAQKRLEELKVKLSEQASSAQQKAAEAQAKSSTVTSASLAQSSAATAMTNTSAGSVGTFVSGVASQIVGGGIQDDIADATKQTAENTGMMVDKLRDLASQGLA